MPNKKYKVLIDGNEKTFSVGDSKYNDFIQKYPNAQPVSSDPIGDILSNANFQNDPANAETNVGSGLPSGLISLDIARTQKQRKNNAASNEANRINFDKMFEIKEDRFGNKIQDRLTTSTFVDKRKFDKGFFANKDVFVPYKYAASQDVVNYLSLETDMNVDDYLELDDPQKRELESKALRYWDYNDLQINEINKDKEKKVNFLMENLLDPEEELTIENAYGKNPLSELFEMEETEGVAAMEELFSSTNLNFEEDKAGFDVVKVTIPGVDDELLLQFDTDDAAEDVSLGAFNPIVGAIENAMQTDEDIAKRNIRNVNQFKSFLEKHADKIEVSRNAIITRKQAVNSHKKLIQQEVENNPSYQEEIKLIGEKYNRKNLEDSNSETSKLFNGKMEVMPVNALDGTYVQGDNKEYFVKGVLADKYDKTVTDLQALPKEELESKMKDFNVSTIEDLAKVLVLNQETLSETIQAKAKYFDIYIGSLDTGYFSNEDEKLQGKIFANNMIASLQNTKQVREEILQQNFIVEEVEFNAAVGELALLYSNQGYLSEEQMDVLIKAFNKQGVFVNPYENEFYSEETISTNEDGETNRVTKVRNKFVEENLKSLYDKTYIDNQAYRFLFDENNKKLENLAKEGQDINTYLDVAARNYNYTEKMLTNVGLGFQDIVMGVGNLGYNVITLGTQMDEESAFSRYYESAQRKRASFQRDIDFSSNEGGAFSSLENFGAFVMQEATMQVPIITTIMATGPYALYVIGAQSAGEKQMDMTYQVLNGKLDPMDSHLDMWFRSIGYGVAEAGFAYVSTIPILKRAQKTWLAGSKNNFQLYNNSAKKWWKENSKGLATDLLAEPLSEMGTVTVQNMLDGNFNNIFQGVDHAGFSGFGFSLLFSGTPFIRGAYNSKFSSYESTSEIRSKIAEITELRKRLNVVKIQNEGSSVYKQLEADITRKQKEVNQLIRNNSDLIENVMGSSDIQTTIAIRNKQFELQTEANNIINNKDLSPEMKKKLIAPLESEFKVYDGILNNSLSNSNKRKLRTTFLNLQATDDQAYNNYINRAEQLLISENNNVNPDPQKTIDKAYELFVYDKVKEKNNNTSAIDIQEFETVDEATNEINKLVDNQTLTREEGDQMIQNIEEGADGVAVKDTDVTIAVVENQVKNEQLYVKTHEIGHQVFWKIFGNSEIGFSDVSNQLLKSMEKADNKMYQELIKDTRIYKDGNLDPKEVISVFLEYAAAGKLKNNKKLGGLFGVLVNQKLKDFHDFDFRGADDMYEFSVALGKKIQDGTLTMDDIQAASESNLVEKSKQKDLENQVNETREAPSDIAESSGTNLEGLINNYVVREMNKDRRSNGMKPLPNNYVPIPTKKREKINGFINEMLTKDANGNIVSNFMNSRLVTQSDALGPYITTISNKIWNGLDPMNREGQTLETWRELVASELSTMIQQEYLRPNSQGVTNYQELDKFVRNRGYFRVFELARQTFKQTPTGTGLDNVVQTESQIDLEAQQAELDQLKKDRANRTDFMSRVKIVDSNNKLIPLPERVINKTKDNIVKTFRTKKFKNEVGTNKHRVELSKEYSGPIGLVFKNIMQRGENFDNDIKLTNQQKRANYSKFLSQNYDLIYDLDIDILTKKYPFLVENTGVRMNAEQIRAYNDAIDKGIRTGRKIKDIKSGPFIFEKIDKVKGKIEYLKYFEGDNVAANVRGARQLSLADEFAQQVSFDLQSDVLIDNRLKTEDFVQKLAKSTGRVAFSFVRGLPDAKQRQFIASLPDIAARVNPSSTNWGDAESIEKTFKNVLSGILPNFTKGEISQVAKKIAKFANRFDLMDPVLKQKAQSDNVLEQYLIESVTEAGENTNIKNFLNLENDIGFYFNDKVRLEKHRGLVLDYIRNEDGTVDKNKLLDILKYRSMYTGAGKIGSGTFTILEGSIVEDKNATRSKEQRYQVFKNVADLYNHLNTLTGVNIEGNSVTINGETLSIPSLIPQTSAYALGNPDYEAGLAQAKEARQFVKDMISKVVDGKNYDNADLAMLIKQLDSQMTAPLKTAADLKYVIEGKLDPKKAKYEHMIPTNWVVMNLLNAYKNNRSSADGLANEIFENYNVAVIPNAMDTFLTKIGLQSVMPVGYKLGEPSWNRYYNMMTLGNKNFVAIRDLSNNSIIGQDWADAAVGDVQVDKVYNKIKKYQAQTKALNKGSSILFSKIPKGISVWDFDDTLARTKSNVLYTLPDGTKGKIDATQFALRSGELEAQGAIFDFSEFSRVMKGQKGPLFEKAVARNKKFGNKNVFILTARPQNAAPAIHTFLKGIGLDIRLENIVGLEDGTAKAKADWMVTKIAEGYNDFYFADDAIKNVKAVKQIYDNFDVKGKVQQAKIAYSKTLSNDFNKMIERQKGVGAEKVFSDVVARRRGKTSGSIRGVISSSAQDFRGLTQYVFAGKGKQGEADQKFFEDALMTPYFKGIARMETYRQQAKKDVAGLLNAFSDVKKKLNKTIPDGDFTHDAAVRVYLWSKAGETIPGISKRDQAKLVKFVENDASLKGYADGLLEVSGKEKWPAPEEYWDSQTTLSDLNNLTDKANRKEFLAEFNENVDIIFSPENLNKVEALYGKKLRSAIEDSIYAMKTGSNRTAGSNRINNGWLNWINNSVGTIMFFNRRSALLQLISTTNFINWSDNNILKAGLAFANQKQYWKDWTMIWNSDKLKQRRGGLQSDVQEAEIAAAAKNSKDKVNAVISKLLKLGFTPTKLADSFAIATGGASFYRNRVNTYLKQGLSQAEAEAKAFQDFSKVSDEAQQSGDPALISQQQRSTAGRLILAFQNTPMQYTRLMEKAAKDLINGRGDAGTNISKIVYYGAVQNLIFNALQNAFFALIPGFDDEEEPEFKNEKERKKYYEKLELKESQKHTRILNGMIDSVLRGTGIYGAVASTIKNTIMKYNEQEQKGFTADHAYTIIEAANISPPIGSKFRKIYSAIQTKKFDNDVIEKHPWDVTIDGRFNPSPSYDIIGSLSSALLNLPLDRVMIELKGIAEMLDERNTAMQRLALGLGWRTWGVNAKNEEFDLIKAEAKEKRRLEGIEKAKRTREENKRLEQEKKNNMTLEQLIRYEDSIKRRRSESARKGVETRRRNKRKKDSLETIELQKLINQMTQQ
jgi:hypothetical protein|tara:strand:+ start:3972 stop:13340 length:9369 start_codon:yes stop_codon:yes gene_type:complete